MGALLKDPREESTGELPISEGRAGSFCAQELSVQAGHGGSTPCPPHRACPPSCWQVRGGTACFLEELGGPARTPTPRGTVLAVGAGTGGLAPRTSFPPSSD